MAEKQSKLPWILLMIAISATGVAAVVAVTSAEEAREAKVEADEAWDSAGVLLGQLEIRNERLPLLVDSLNAYWMARIDSIAILPPELPPQDPRLQALLDTAAVTRELRLAIDAQTQRLRIVEQENADLRERVVTLAALTEQAIDSVNTFWQAEREQDLLIIASLRTAVEKSREEANRWETAYYASRMSWLDRAKWGLGGAVVGYLANEFTGSDVTVNSCNCDSYDPTFSRVSFKAGAN